ncbi:MAG TPA: HAD-IB family phosphatase [Dehalococcoidia bacterium]|nr:HAD-IB family phosphatase [Dehalococcoidia bacterium]
MKLAVQCDFDGTITEEDISFLILDTFVGNRWREMLTEYLEGRIPVGAFNKKVFAMVRADKQTQLDVIFNSDRVKIRPGLRELVDYCSQKGYRFIIVSNGLTFYIGALLEREGIRNAEVFAATNEFRPEGMIASYIGPDGREMDAGFKEAYTKLLIKNGYEVAYAGNGVSDIYPSRLAKIVFATGDLLRKCEEEKLAYTPFDNLHDVVRGLKTL